MDKKLKLEMRYSMEDSDIIILDEPFNGIEANSVTKISKILKEEKKKGKLIIISTHIKEDLDNLSDFIYYFDAGEVRKGEVEFF